MVVTTLVLLPGMDGSGDFFSPFVRCLSPHLNAQVVRYPSDRPLNYAQLTDWVAERLPSGEQYCVLAESFSGPIGIELAARSPQGMAGLVLCCTFADCPRPALRWLAPVLPWVPQSLLPIWLIGRALMGRDFDPALQRELARVLASLPASVTTVRALATLRVDVLAKLRQVQMPVLYLQAAADLVVPERAMRRMLAAQRAIQVCRLPGPHFLLQTRPDEAARAVEGFVSHLQAHRR
ncbi:alpha/beta fold hydrolase [Roseateles paludis]|uniref:alpha/beta fold hydrolase n=1 Tax=Roseateles paludis TaxID=3145238 RepID=UPI003D344205